MTRPFWLIAALSLLAPLSTAPAMAQGGHNSNHTMSSTHMGVVLEAPWARASATSSHPSAVYITIRNTGEDDELVSVASSASAVAEIHESKMENGIMKMRPVAPLAIAAGQTIEMKPGGYHIMLINLVDQLKEGDMIDIAITFKNAGTIETSVPVRKVGSMSAGDGYGHNHGGMSNDSKMKMDGAKMKDTMK